MSAGHIQINAAVAASDQAATERDTAAAGSEEHSRATQLANYYTQKVQQLEQVRSGSLSSSVRCEMECVQAKADTLDCNFDFSPDVMASAGARIAAKQQELLPHISTARGRLKEFRHLRWIVSNAPLILRLLQRPRKSEPRASDWV